VIEGRASSLRRQARRDDGVAVDFEALGRALAEFCDEQEAAPLLDLMQRLMREMKGARRRP
jgi:hypothetical protein